jgi:hypothetical protein
MNHIARHMTDILGAIYLLCPRDYCHILIWVTKRDDLQRACAGLKTFDPSSVDGVFSCEPNEDVGSS